MKNGVVPNWALAQAARKKKAEEFATAMKGNAVPTVKVEHATQAESVAVTTEILGPRKRLEIAIEELNRREKSLLAEVERLEKLQNEATEVGRQKSILSDALAQLAGTSPQGAAAN
jgi:hypothetical protein